MADSNSGHSSNIKQTPLDSNQFGQAHEPNIPPYVNRNIIDEQKSNYGNTTQADLGASMEAHGQAVKDQVDGAVVTGPKRADQSSGGRVQVGEQGDLHDLAARRQP